MIAPVAETDAFASSRDLFEAILGMLEGEEAAQLSHGELEERLEAEGRSLLRRLLQDHLELRALREERLNRVTGADGVARGNVEIQSRPLGTVFGEVVVERLAYRRPGHDNLYPADGVLNLPAEKHSHGLRKLAAVEAARGSFEGAQEAIERATGQKLAKRQVEELAARAAVDFDHFYARRPLVAVSPGDVLVLSCDGKGIVMRPEALRKPTQAAAARASPKLKTRLSKGEKGNRKRMAEVGCVYDASPVPRVPADILVSRQRSSSKTAPKARNKWAVASVVEDASAVVGWIFDEAERRDPKHLRPWVALVDGNNHQIERIQGEAHARDRSVPIVIDFVHVLEYVWKAAWSFYAEGDPAAEKWVHEKGIAILEGQASQVAGAMRRSATKRGLDQAQREGADKAADYLLRKRPHLDYPTALANGWPIASGVIEGACRHLVKDRMDLTGARWGLEGAEAVLKLRVLRANADFTAYWRFHTSQERLRVHATRYRNELIPGSK
jgi:hypothetical protein